MKCAFALCYCTVRNKADPFFIVNYLKKCIKTNWSEVLKMRPGGENRPSKDSDLAHWMIGKNEGGHAFLSKVYFYN